MANQDALEILKLSLSNQVTGIDLDSAYVSLRPHYLCGWFYKRHRGLLSDPNWHEEYTRQSLQNSLLINELEHIEASIPAVRLKGSSFFPWLYRDYGERHLTDADILIDPKYLESSLDELSDRGYKVTQQVKWGPNHHRLSLTRSLSSGFLYQLDIHTQLHWEQQADLKITCVPYGSFSALRKDFLFYHLCMNWAFQDTFVGLNKLLDIHLLWNKMDEIDRGKSQKLFHSQRYLNVWKWVMVALDTLQGKNSSSILTSSFLSHPEKSPLRYLLLKHLNKKNFFQALKYDYLWTNAYLQNSERP